VITTADDAEAALAVVHAHLAAGDLTVSEASSLMLLIERMIRLAERIEKMRQAERERQEAEAHAQSAAAVAAALASETAVPASAAPGKSAGASAERLYSPVNLQTSAPAERPVVRASQSAPAASGEAAPQAKAA
jgi:hypothetical protein